MTIKFKLQKQSSWTAGTVSKSALTSGDVWIQYSLTSRPLALGFLMFKPSEVTQIKFEGCMTYAGFAYGPDGTGPAPQGAPHLCFLDFFMKFHVKKKQNSF